MQRELVCWYHQFFHRLSSGSPLPHPSWTLLFSLYILSLSMSPQGNPPKPSFSRIRKYINAWKGELGYNMQAVRLVSVIIFIYSSPQGIYQLTDTSLLGTCDFTVTWLSINADFMTLWNTLTWLIAHKQPSTEWKILAPDDLLYCPYVKYPVISLLIWKPLLELSDCQYPGRVVQVSQLIQD